MVSASTRADPQLSRSSFLGMKEWGSQFYANGWKIWSGDREFRPLFEVGQASLGMTTTVIPYSEERA